MSQPTEPVVLYFVIQRTDGADWTTATKIFGFFATEGDAEAYAIKMKTTHPQQYFGVAVLRSEARPVSQPVEIVHIS